MDIAMPDSYDIATPQDWFDMVCNRTGQNPYGHIVWSYDDFLDGKSNIFGLPYPVDEVGLEMMQRLVAGIRGAR